MRHLRVSFFPLQLIMDARVKPAHDAEGAWLLSYLRPAARNAFDLRAHDALDQAGKIIVEP